MNVGDDWFRRNHDRLGKTDIVSSFIQFLPMRVNSVLEVGCANGWRLKKLQRTYGCAIAGIDPSTEAIKEANEVTIMAGSADFLPFPDDSFDLVIMGFCLYLVQPQDLFKVVAESDRVLRHKGYLIVHDFIASEPYKVPYVHLKGVWSYHYNQPAMWLSHPGYSFVGGMVGDQEDSATVMQKDFDKAFPAMERLS